MIDALPFIGARATWELQHSAMPDAPVVAEPARRRPTVRPRAAALLRAVAELLDPRARSAAEDVWHTSPA